MAKKNIWFEKRGWVHVPIILHGWVILLLGVLFGLNVIFAVGMRAHSVSDMLYGTFPFLVPTFLLYEWIASHKS